MPYTKEDIRALATAEYESHEVYNSAKTLRNRKRELILRAVTKIIDGELENIYGADIKAKGESYNLASLDHFQAKEQAAIDGLEAPAPLGTIYQEWNNSSVFRDGKRTREWYLTGKKAVLEAITRNSQHPENRASYSNARVGEYVLRTLKKDGTAGASYTRLRSMGIPHGWFPEGERPDSNKE